MRKLIPALFAVATFALYPLFYATAQTSEERHPGSPRTPATARVLHPALGFEPNQGQAPSSVLFQAKGSGYLLALEQSQFRIELSGKAAVPSSVAIRFLDANPAAPLTGQDKLLALHNYISGTDPAASRTNIPTYGKVAYGSLYHGIDLSFYGNPDHLEYDFNLAPGSDPAQIRLALDGAKSVAADRDGNLVLELNRKTLRFLRPVAYQTRPDGSRKPVEVAYRVASLRSGRLKSQTLTFAVGSYDRSLPLVIDPVVDYSFYLPATVSGHLFAAASTTDAAGNTYIGGALSDTDGGAPGYQAGYYVEKFNSAGQELFQTIFGTKIFPNFNGNVNAIAVDAAGKVYLVGEVSGAYGGALGQTPNGYETSAPNNYQNGFLSVVSADGSALTYSTYFAGSGGGSITALAVDSSGGAYVGGTATGTLPLTPGAPFTTPFGLNGTRLPGFVAKFDTTQTGTPSLVYSTFLGATAAQVGAPGSQVDAVNAIAVDSSGNAYVTGNANQGAVYPTTPGAFRYDGRSPLNDAYVTKINPTGTAFSYSALLGPGSGYAIALDGSNNVYIAGAVYEDDFPTTSGAYQTSYSDGFVTELNSAGSALVYSTFLGGPSGQFTTGAQLVPQHIALPPNCASSCEAYVAGYTNLTDLPLINQIQGYIPGTTYSGFYVELSGNGAAALQSSYFPSGAGFDPYLRVPGIGVDSAANIYLTGDVLTPNLPVTQAPPISGEGFLARISPATGATLIAVPPSVSFGKQIAGVSTIKQGLAQPTVLLENLGTEPASISSIAVNPGNVFAATNTCNGSVPAGGNCTLTLNFTPGPVSANPQTGTIKLTSNATLNPTISLTGTAIDDRYMVASCGGVTPCPGLNFPDTAVGSASPAQIVTLTNLGDTAVAFSSIATSTADYSILTNCPQSGATLAHNATCELSVQFRPSQAGNRPATISAASTGTTANPIALAATGTGLLSPNASSLVLIQTIQNFGSEVIGGTSATMTVTVFNNGSAPATVFIPSVATSGDATGINDYAIVSNTCTGVELLPETHCDIGLAFVPTATGTRSGTITIPNSTSTTLTSSLTGIGLAAKQMLEFSPASVTFADQAVNIQTGNFTATIFNVGTSPVTIDRVVISGASFVLTSTTCPTATLPTAATPSYFPTCTVTVAFNPVAAGPQTGTVTLIDTEGRQSAFSLAGKGIAQNGSVFLNPDGLYFGYAPVGAVSASQQVNVQDNGNIPISVTGASTTGDFAVNTAYCATLPYTLTPGAQNCLKVYFTPTKVANPDTGTLTVTTSAGTKTVNLGGIGLQPLKSVVLTPPAASGVYFGSIQVGNSANSYPYRYLLDLFNSGSDPVTFSTAPVIGGANASDFSIPSEYGGCGGAGFVLNPGTSCPVYLQFTPAATGTRVATLTITDDASTGNGTQTVPLSGIGTTATPSSGFIPNTVAFGPQVITTTSAASPVTFYNNSSVSVTIASTTFQPAGSFSHSQNYYGDCDEGAVAPGKSCLAYVLFSPAVPGMTAATMTLTDTAGNSYQTNLFGYATLPGKSIALSPSGLDFEPQPLLSQSGTQKFVLTNNSGTPVSLGQATGTNVIVGASSSGVFNVTADSCSNNSAFRSDYPNNSCGITVDLNAVAGTTLGNQSGSISLPVTYRDGTTATLQMQLNGTVVPDIDSVQLNESPLLFPDEAVNATPSANAGDGYQSFTISNRSNLPIKIGQAALVNTFNYAAARGSSTSSFGYNPDGCSNQTIQPGSSCSVQIAFLPLTAGQNITGSMSFPINFVDGTTKTLTATYSGNALPANNSLLISPNSANFGENVVGQTGGLFPFTVKNNGNQPVAFGAYSLTSTQSGTNFGRYSFDYNSCSGSTLAVGASCTFNIYFTPQSVGTINGTLTIADGAATGGPHTIPLVGTGVAATAPVTASQYTVGFGNQTVGVSSLPQVVYLTNVSTANIGSATYTLGGTNSSDFKLISNCGTTLFNRASCGLQVVFSPATASLGARSATVTVAYGTTGATLVINLNGTGVPPTPVVSLFPNALVYNTQDIGTTSPGQAFSVTNTGSAALTITSVASGSAEFALASNACNGVSLNPGANCLVTVAFKPTAAGTHSGTISVTDNAANSPQTVSLSALVPKAALSVTSLTFPAQTDGTTSAAQTATLSNTGTGPLYISTIALGGTNASSFTQTNTCGTYLAAGGVCSISVKFAPTAAGTLTATVIVTDNAGLAAGSTQSLALSGTGIAPISASVSPASVAFANTRVGSTSSYLPVTLTNTGSATLTGIVFSVTGTNASSFFLPSTHQACGTTLAAGASCTFDVAFKPTTGGALTAAVQITDNASNSPQTVALSGTGIAALSASVSPTSIAFATTTVGSTSSYVPVTLTNNGSSTLSAIALSVTGSNASSFFLPSSHQGCTATLAAGASCTFDVAFKPTATGPLTGSVTITNNATNSPQTVTLSGTGR